MFDAGMNTDTLRECLLNLPPLELLGMVLLKNTAHAGFFPSDVEHETLKVAVVEVIEYGERCQQIARRLSHLKIVGGESNAAAKKFKMLSDNYSKYILRPS